MCTCGTDSSGQQHRLGYRSRQGGSAQGRGGIRMEHAEAGEYVSLAH